MANELEVYDEPSDHDGKDYVVQIRIKNGPLLRAMRMRGFKTIAQFSRACGLNNPNSLTCYFNLKKAPLRRDGKWVSTVLKMAQTLRLPPGSLFPEQHLETALRRNSGEIEVSREELCLLLEPPNDDAQELYERRQLYEKLNECIGELTPREQKVLTMRFGLGDEASEHTLEDIATEFGLTRGRILQIEDKALHKLRHKNRVKKLVDCGGYGFVNLPDTSSDDERNGSW